MGTLPVFLFLNSMIISKVNYFLLLNLSMGNIVYQCPAYPTTRSGVNKAILGTGIKRIFPIYEFGMKNNIPLLTSGHAIRKSFPGFEVMSTGYTCCCNS